MTRRRERAWRQPDVTGEHVTILVTGKCVAACRCAVLRWARRGKICPLYQERRCSRCSLIVRRLLGLLSSNPGDALRAPSGTWRQPILSAPSIQQRDQHVISTRELRGAITRVFSLGRVSAIVRRLCGTR
jgi:hypothetical protein